VLWASGARVSKDDHWVAAEQDLRSGKTQRVRAGAGDASGGCGSSGGGGKAKEDAWHGSERRGGGGGPAHGRQERQRRIGQRNKGGRAGGGSRGLVCDFPKVQGSYCNVLVTFKLELQWKWAQKSVGFIKIYNFALRFISKRAKDLDLL
jgi:hypothetical protein